MPDHGNINSLGIYRGPEYKTEGEETKLQKLDKIKSVVTYVARTLEPIRLSRNNYDHRFPDGLKDEVSCFLVMYCNAAKDGLFAEFSFIKTATRIRCDEGNIIGLNFL